MTSGQADRPKQGFARHFVTDRRRFNLSIEDLIERAASAARRGATVVQVRERDLPDRDLAALVRRVRQAVSGTAARVLVNDRADLAMAAGADGVHLRADSAIASRVRGMVPAGFILGRSVHSMADVDAAALDGACDYLLFGTVFPSTGKPEGHPIAGLDALRLACARTAIPIIAIGGMTEQRALQAMQAGAAGFAAVDLFIGLTPLPEVV
ncbi:MAG: thiamine phosphate synthase [Vicinamibacterales bacterium]